MHLSNQQFKQEIKRKRKSLRQLKKEAQQTKAYGIQQKQF